MVPDVDLVNCRDPALGGDQDPRKPSPCTGITVDLNGAIWFAIRKANSHSLFKMTERVGASCTAGATALTPPPRDLPNTVDIPATAPQRVPHICAREGASGRPELVDLTAFDGEVAGNFPSGPGVLGLEARKTVAYFRDATGSDGLPLPPLPVADGKAWGLSGKEGLFSAAFLQIAPSVVVPAHQSFVVVTTSNGRVLAITADGTGTPFTVFEMPSCASSEPQAYGIRVRAESERVDVSDRACRRVYALSWTNLGNGSITLQNATEDVGQAGSP